MAKFTKLDSLADFQKLTDTLYTAPNDKLFSLYDLVSIEARYMARSIKGIRKDDHERLSNNMLHCLSWLMSLANRLKVDMSEALWKRFPGVCSFCGKRPCVCKIQKLQHRVKIKEDLGRKPRTVAALQKDFAEIYPAEARTLAHAGIHLAEEMGEVSEAIHRYYAAPDERHFAMIKLELADYLSVIFNVVNSGGIDLAEALAAHYHNNCPNCHTAPCTCNLTEAAASAT